MIKTFLFSAALIAGTFTAAIAQPTITAATNSPVAGDVFYGHFCDTNGVSKGAAGANVLWDMSKLVRHDSDTTYYLACTPSCDSFPAGNLISANGNASDTTYYNSASGAFDVLGNVSSGTFSRFIDSMRIITYPFAYTNSIKDTAYSAQDLGSGDSLKLYLYNTITYDGWGSLKLPDGVFRNAARIHTNTITKTIVTFSGFPFSDSSESDNYSLYVSGFHNAVLSVAYDTANTGTSHVTDVTWYTGTGYNPLKSALRTYDQPVTAAFSIAPNPAQNEVHFRFTLGSSAAAIVVTDVTGRTVGTIPAGAMKEGANDITFPVSGLTEGMYIVRLQTADGVQSHKFSVVK